MGPMRPIFRVSPEELLPSSLGLSLTEPPSLGAVAYSTLVRAAAGREAEHEAESQQDREQFLHFHCVSSSTIDLPYPK